MGSGKKSTLIFLGLILIFSVSWILYSTIWDQDSKARPPNILLISLDACRADHLSCYGYSRATSPFLDELATRGIRFENAFVNTHGTPSSHTTMFTSLYEQTHSEDFWEVPVAKKFAKGFFFTIPENIILLQEMMRKNGYCTIGVTGGEMFKKMKFDRGFDAFEYTSEVSGIESGTDKLISLIERYSKKGKPIFGFFHTYEIHSPYLPPEEYRKIFGDIKSQFRPTSKNLLRYVSKSSKLSKNDLDYTKMMYDAGIRYADDTLREMFARLESLGFFDNYLVLITADHGEEFGDHGGLLHRGLLYDELLHVPLIVVGSSVVKGIVDRRLVSTIDIMPTIMDVAGIEMDIPVEGKSLLSGNINLDVENEMVFSQYGNLRYSVRTHKWKLIEGLKPARLELYNLYEDPEEQKDISKEHPELRDKLKNIIAKWRVSRARIADIKREEIQYTNEDIEKLRALGYVN